MYGGMDPILDCPKKKCNIKKQKKMTKKIKGKKSTCAVESTYNESRQDLTIIFPSGKQYVYTPVSEEFAKKFEKAKSKGNFFNKHIRNNPALTKLKSV